MERECVKEKIEVEKLPLRKDIVINTIIAMIVRCILRYLLMAAYILACNEFGLYNYGFIAKIVVTLTSICVSRWIMREIGVIIYGDGMDDEVFETVGIVHCIRGISRMIKRL